MPSTVPKRLTKRQRDLVEKNIPLAYHFADRLMSYASAKCIQRDDLRQEAVMLLMCAVPKFNPYLGYRLSTYAGKCIHFGLLRYIDRHHSPLRTKRGDKNPPRLIWGDKPSGEDGETGVIWSMLGIEDDFSSAFVQEFLERSRMSTLDRDILTDRLSGLIQSEIAEKHGYSQPQISRKLCRFRSAWRQYDRAAQCTTTKRPNEDIADTQQRLPSQDTMPACMEAI